MFFRRYSVDSFETEAVPVIGRRRSIVTMSTIFAPTVKEAG